MHYLPETQAAIDGLCKLKQRVNRAEVLDQEIEQLQEKKQRITNFVQNADSRITKLPENHYITLEEQYRQKIFKEFHNRAIMVRVIIMILIVLLGIVGIMVMLSNSHIFEARAAMKTAMAADIDKNSPAALSINANVFVAILYMTAVTVAAVIYSFAQRMSPFDDPDEWVSVYGAVFFLTAWCAPVLAAGTCVYFMFKIHPLYALIPIAIVAGMVGCRVIQFMGIGVDRDFTAQEKKLLEEAQALDEQNGRINKQKAAAAIAKASAAAEPTLEELAKTIRDKQMERAALDEEIEHNGYLFTEDLDSLPRIVHLLKTGRAETIKEALVICDRMGRTGV